MCQTENMEERAEKTLPMCPISLFIILTLTLFFLFLLFAVAVLETTTPRANA